jgi:hypothetical protein
LPFQPGYLQEVPRMDPPREEYLPRPHRRPRIFDRDPKWRDVDTFSLSYSSATELYLTACRESNKTVSKIACPE